MKKLIKPSNNVARESALFDGCGIYDFEDSYSINLERSDVESWEPVAAFLQSSPKWVLKLIGIRNKVAKMLGLKVGIKNIDINPPFKPGQSFGALQLYSINRNEAVIGESDKHLDFKVSLLLKGSTKPELTLSTAVRINNKLGNVYMFFVKPAHKLIVPAMLKRMALDINNRSLVQHGRSKI